jgi:hypothetical protein
MRAATLLLMTLLAGIGGQAGDKNKAVARFGIDPDTKAYPHQTPKEALGSVLKAIGENQFNYLLAHLADPAFVDQQVSANMPKINAQLNESAKRALAFNQLVQATEESFRKDPSKLAELQRFFTEGEWQDDGNEAVATLKGLQARKVFMKRIGPDRWGLLNREK